MRLVAPRSEVVAEATGWTWLQPVRTSTRRRHTLGTFLLATLIVIGMATATLLPPPASVAATVAVAGAAIALFVAILRSAASRIALSGAGVYLQEGAHAQEVGWAAVRGLTTAPRRGRVRIVIDDGYRSRTTRSAFDVAPAAKWLEEARHEAARRRLHPIVAPDGMGFTTPS